MSAAKKKKKTKKKQRRGVSLGPLIDVAGRAGGWVGLVVVFGGLAIGAGRLETRVGEIRSDPVRAEFAWPSLGVPGSTWMPLSERRRLTDLLLASVSLDPMDTAGLALARERLLLTGWFEDDLRLVRGPGGVIDVHGEWRDPVAVVEVQGEAHVVSDEATRLPLTYTAGGAGSLRFIRGVWGTAPRAGEVWAGGDVEAAIALLAELRASQAWPAIAGVDASRYARTQMLSVMTTEGAEVVWGSAPGAPAVGQVPQEMRVARLEALVSDPSWAAAGRPRVELHLPRPVINESAARD